MQRLAKWAAVCISVVGVQLYFTHKFLAPYLRANWYGIYWSNATDSASGWPTMAPRYAWPALVTYGGALVVVASVIAVAVGRTIVLRERMVVARREAAAAAQAQEAERILTQAREIERAAENQVQAAMIQASRHKQEAAAQVEEAEFRLQRSVNTNIGLRRQIQELKKRVNEQGDQGTMGSC